MFPARRVARVMRGIYESDLRVAYGPLVTRRAMRWDRDRLTSAVVANAATSVTTAIYAGP